VATGNSALRAAGLLLLSLLAAASAPVAVAQQPFQTDAVAPGRFIAAHGRKAVVMGYAAGGLEAWAYPLQLVSGYEIGFRAGEDTTEVSGPRLLRRVTYEPQAITRTYIGPDYIVRERLFVPLEEAAMFFTYTVECRHAVEIVIHFTPVLDLMWPLSIGGQNVQWQPAASAYVLNDGTHRYSAMIGSPQVTSHDAVRNSIEPGALGNRLAFTVRAGGGAGAHATVVVSEIAPGALTAADRMKQLIAAQPGFETEASQHYVHLAAGALRITTPDAGVNQQLAWAQAALDQAWVCNPVLGCGLVAGYGPSRPGRRPQYDWFFAGDGLIGVEALVNTEAFDRARDELTFIAKYQDAQSGMIWHEISQSADPADWATRYPYMFVHVDITFQYLIAVEHYVAASGDTQFLQEHWPGIAAAYRYCTSLRNPADGLPRIPASKEGGDEQDKITDDLDLSVSWVAAASAFQQLAEMSSHRPLAEQAARALRQARVSATTHYWDDQHHLWIDGYNESGSPIFREGDNGIRLVTGGLLDPTRSNAILDRLATTDFQTDWGTRGVSAQSPQYDPSSYSKGSVSAAGSAGIAAAFWSQHRPLAAFSIWRAVLPWGTLDSMGHMHEVLAGDFYHQQSESVPEQTWSSAAFLSSTVQGLLGLTREAEHGQLTFAPHMPANWNEMSVENIKVAGGTVALRLSRVAGGLDLTAVNSGGPVAFRFSPEIPLGARLLGATWEEHAIRVENEPHPQDDHATIIVPLPSGKSHAEIRFAGGVLLSVDAHAPWVGDPSRGIKITSVSRRGASLLVGVDTPPAAPPGSAITLWTAETPRVVHGATLSQLSPNVFQLTVGANDHRAQIEVIFAP
jgi:glycogen debranching enzyme